jgi:DNA-binding response OmpR family regulator
MTSTLKLLVLEDAEADFRLIVRHLRQHGFEADCQRVVRLEELDRALTFDDIDAVLAHYHVPGLEIQDSLTRIRADALGLRLLYQPLVDQHTARISGYQSVGTVHG